MMLPKLPKLPKMKLRFTSGTVGVLILIITICFIVVSIRYDAIRLMSVEISEPPIPVRQPVHRGLMVPTDAPQEEVPYLSLNSIVEVSVESLNGMYQGGGLRIGNVVVTSAMIFNGRSQIVTVNGVETEIIKRDDSLGLIALRSRIISEALDDCPSTPTGEAAQIVGTRNYDVKVFRYISDRNRMILTGDIPAHAAGYPVMQGTSVIGLVIGLNSANVRQGIAVSKQGLVKFIADEVEQPWSYSEGQFRGWR